MNGRGQHHLRLLSVGALHFAADQQIEFLVGAAQFDVRLQRDRIVSLGQRVEQFVHGDGLFFLKAFVEVFALEHLRNREFGGEANPVRRLHLVEPLAVEAGLGLGLGRES